MKQKDFSPDAAGASRTPVTFSVILRKLTATAVLAAMGVALAYVPRILTVGGLARLDLAILPAIVAAVALGPLWSCGVYALTDLVGCLFNGYAPFLPILGCKILLGLWLGFCLYRKPIRWRRSAFCLVTAGVLIDFALMGLSLRLFYGKPWIELIVSRSVTAGLNLAVRLVFLQFAAGRLSGLLCRIMQFPVLPKEENTAASSADFTDHNAGTDAGRKD